MLNELIRGVYHAVKEARPSAQFGISPEGYVEHLRSDNRLFADVDVWLSHDGYVDYIMPQIYWGFEHQLSNGSPAPFAFENNLKTWISLVKRGHAKLYHRTGRSIRPDATQEIIPGFRSGNDMTILSAVGGGSRAGKRFGIRLPASNEYSSFQDEACQKEVRNLMKVFR
ncbi:MAG: family 10 glycosylhydrolase [Clostridium sp.]